MRALVLALALTVGCSQLGLYPAADPADEFYRTLAAYNAVAAVAEGALWAFELAAICGALSATAPSRAFPARDRAAAGGALGTALGTALEA